MLRTIALLSLCLVFAAPAIADSNLHTVTGTMTSCGCEPYGSVWQCTATVTTAAPPQHFTEARPATINFELTEQAIGQCGAIYSSLPRKVQVLFWIHSLGNNHLYGTDPDSKAYYLIDLGNP